MSYHSSLEYSCKNCGENYLPFKSSMNCPKCETPSSEESNIIQETFEALEMHGYEHPGVYGVFSLGDTYIYFALQVVDKIKVNESVEKLAKRFTENMAEGEEYLQEHYCKFLQEILPKVLLELFSDKTPLGQSDLHETNLQNKKFDELNPNNTDYEDANLKQETTLNTNNNFAINEENLKAISNLYFQYYPLGNFKILTEKIKISRIKLAEIQSSMFHLSMLDLKFWDFHFANKKIKLTQSNLIQYAIEFEIDLNWDNSDKSYERIKVIASIRNQFNINKKTDIDDKFYEQDDYYDNDSNYAPDDFYSSSRGISNHPKYNDNLDANQQDFDVYE
jgi:uncharacterized OB-fold protein